MSQRPGPPQGVKSPGINEWLFLFWKYIVDFALNNLADVTITSAASGNYLRYNGTVWVNVAVSQILTDLLTVDGAGSGLDADLLDGQTGSYYLDSANFTGTNWTDLTDGGDTTLHTHDGRYYTESEVDAIAAAVVAMIITDHGGLTGLSDNDHPQYLLVADIDDTPVNGVVDAPISSNWAYDHVAAADPHTGYVLESVLTTNGDIFVRLAGAVDRLGVGSEGDVLTISSGLPAWVAPAGGSGASADIMQSTHGLAVGDIVKYTGSAYAKAQADSAANAEVVGIVSAVADADNFTLLFIGAVTGLSGLTAGTVYFLDPSTAGAMTATEPSTADQVSKPVFIAYSTTAGYFFNMRGKIVADATVALYSKYSGTATAGQTSLTATYTPGALDVFVNGVKLAASDYTATSGSAVVLSVGMSAGDFWEVIAWVVGVDYVSSTQPVTPQGRLTLATGTPVMSSEQANKTTVYYTPYRGNVVPIWSGSAWGNHSFSELSIAMAASANWAANSNYDLFVINDAGTLRLVTGAAWSSDTARNEGIELKNGIYVNSSAFTGRYGASSTTSVGQYAATYVGTMRTTGSTGTTTWELGGAADGGDAGFLYLWNCYNRILASVRVADTTDNWSYSTVAWRSMNASTANRISFVTGLATEPVEVQVHGIGFTSASVNFGAHAIGVDSTTSPSGVVQRPNFNTSYNQMSMGHYIGQQVGFHFLQAIEYVSSAAMTTTFYGDAGGAITQTGMYFKGFF